MPKTLYVRAHEIAHAVLNCEPAQQKAYLMKSCGDDDELLQEVRWLLAAAEDDALDAIPSAIGAVADDVLANARINGSEPGNYRLLEQIGEGGMGVVWLAERQVGAVRQRVALKRLRLSAVGDAIGHSPASMLQLARFREEQKILASLNHPYIARLLDAGDDRDGAPFLAMEYVDGVSIERWCAEQKLGLRERVQMFIKVCAAVSYAHEHLVIHRDIKPANILVDAAGEPKLLDFGIARLLDSGVQQNATRVMTLAYASPEQIAGRPLGTATDIWSLGVLFYELLTGARPFDDFDTEHARSEAVLSIAVTPPSLHVTSQARGREISALVTSLQIPADVDAIVLKALRRAPEQRYATVRDLSDDLQNYLAARPVKAHQGKWLYRARCFWQRHRMPLAVGVAIFAISAGFTWKTVRAEREARLQAELANRATQFLVSAFSMTDPSQSERHDFSARELLDRGRDRIDRELTDQPRLRARLLDALGNAYRGINEGSAGATLLESAAQLNLSAAVNDPLAAARSLRSKAEAVLAIHGSSVEATQAAQRAFDLVHEHAAQDPMSLADVYSTLALALDVSGNETQALHAAQEALRLRELAQANPHLIALSWSVLCHVNSGSGQHAKARLQCEHAKSLFEQAGAAKSNDYRQVLHRLERTLLYTNQHQSSLAIARQRMALTQELFGEDSSVLAMERIGLAGQLAELCLFDEALSLLAQGTPVILRRNGSHSLQYSRALFHTGWLRFLQGEFDLALPLLRQAMTIVETKTKGDDRGTLQILRTTLARALIESGQANDEARKLLEQVIHEFGPAQAQASTLTYARLPLAQWHTANGNYTEAETLLAFVDAAGTEVELELHVRAAATRAKILLGRGDLSAAVDQAATAFNLSVRDRGAENPRTARYALAYAQMLRGMREINQADRDRSLALEREYRPRLEKAYPRSSAFRR